MTIETAIKYTFDLSNLIERILSLREGECLSIADRLYLVNILQEFKRKILGLEVYSDLHFEHPQETDA